LKVVVFDIDGTLTRTTRVDGEQFHNAIQSVLPAVELESFDEFVEMTDTAILQEVCAVYGACEYASVETRVLERFLDGLSKALTTDPASFSAVPGARTVFAQVRDAGWVPAIATGGWRPSAEMKLAAAGIPTNRVPLATSSEATRRVDIIRNAVTEAASGTEPAEVVYVGDGIWDIRACRELGIGFVGRAEGGDIGRLLDHGARSVVPDFLGTGSFLRLLSEPHHLSLMPD